MEYSAVHFGTVTYDGMADLYYRLQQCTHTGASTHRPSMDSLAPRLSFRIWVINLFPINEEPVWFERRTATLV